MVVGKIKGPRDSLFYCSPCTGGSPWNRYNAAVARERGCIKTLQNIEDHVELHDKLWTNFERAALHCKNVGNSVILEWPRGCSYWDDSRVSAFLERLGFSFCRV